MLGRKIDILRMETAWAFYEDIVRNPWKSRFVKHLDIGKLEIGTHELHRRLLRLIFTPNLQVLRGQNCQSDYYDETIRTAKKSPAKFRNLKVIPHPLSFTKGYRDAVMFFKDTLQDVLVNDLDMVHTGERSLEHLKQFKYLISFAFYSSSINLLLHVDVLLGVLPQVKEIKIYITALANDWVTDRSIEYLKQIPKNHALKSLKITTASAAIMCVLLSKFVSLGSWELDTPYAVMLAANSVPSLNYSFMVLKDDTMYREEITDLFGRSASITSASRLETNLFVGKRIEHDIGVYMVNIKR
ncbi:hypothetical protein MAM1_0211d08071 [Mucor ambiguus]|uniref:Uncharacterized protein n=1 Tax=Mucor ambiguus TaxID=91626 RepID=A0A0C9MY49_9FUNG|nr:hypothetical protein MAM1_0211d08071 [Mucor ambiguus]